MSPNTLHFATRFALALSFAVAPGCADAGGDGGADALPVDTGATLDAAGGVDTQVSSDSGGVVDTTPSDIGGAGGCDIQGWDPQGPIEAYAFSFGGPPVGVFLDSYSAPLDQPLDVIGLALQYADGASTQPHTFVFTDDIADAHTALSGSSDCPDAYKPCGTSFRAMSGTLTITENGGPGGRLTGSLADIVLRETEDANTAVFKEVGKVWCIDSFSFDVEIASL